MSGRGQGACKAFSYTTPFFLWKAALARDFACSLSTQVRAPHADQVDVQARLDGAEPECKRKLVIHARKRSELETARANQPVSNKKRFSPPPCAPRRLRSPARFFFCVAFPSLSS